MAVPALVKSPAGCERLQHRLAGKPRSIVTGSLATILRLQAIRREGEDAGFLTFLKVGAVAMPLALAAALGTRLLIG